MADVKYIVTADTKGAVKEIQKFDDSLDGMKTQSEKSISPLKGMWKQIAAGIGVTTILTSGMRMLSSQVKDTIAKGIEFGREWANVTTMLSTSDAEAGELRKELMGLSPTLGDTTELARGMYQVLSASIEPAAAVEFLGEAAKSAKAGLTEANVAVDALTTVINAYGLEAEDVTGISDIMFQTVKRGKLTYEEMAGALGTVVPVASQVGINFEEVAAAMATMTRQGIDANTATMQLRQVMMVVLGASGELKSEAKDLGFEFTAAALKTKGLSKFLEDLAIGTGGNLELMKKFIPNVRALAGVMALGGEAADDFAYDIKLMGDASGTTEEAFRKQMESAGFWIDTLKASVDKFKIAFIEGFTGPMLEGITSSEDLDEKVAELTKKVEKFGEVLGTLNKFALTPLMTQLELASEKLQAVNFAKGGSFWSLAQTIVMDNIPAFKEFESAVFDVDEDFTGLNAGIEFGEGILKDFNKAVEAGKEWLKNMGDEGGDTTKVIAKLHPQIAMTTFEAKEMKLAWANLLDVLDLEVWGETVEVIEDGEEALEALAIEAIDTGEILKTVMKDVFDAIGIDTKEMEDEVETTFQNIRTFADEYALGISDAFGDAFEDILTEGSDLDDAIGVLFGSLVDNIRRLLGDLLRDFLAKNVFKAMQSEATKATSGIMSTLTGGGGGGAGGLLSGASGAGGIWTGVGAAAGTLLAGLITGPGVSARTGQDTLQEIRLTNILLYQTQQNELHWMDEKLAAIADYTGARIPLKQDKTNRLLGKIYNEFKGIPSGQGGLDFYSGSRGGLFRYHEREHISVRPNFTINPQGISINLDRAALKELQNSGSITYKSKYGHVKIHERAIKRF